MIRIMLAVAFVSFFHRIPDSAVPYFILAFALISIFLAGRGIYSGYFYYYDFINVILFPIFLVTWLLSPQKETAWLINYRGHIIYPLFAIATIIPPILSLPAFHIMWKGEPLSIPTPFVVLWGSTFILSATILWFGAPVRTPLLIIAILTIPTRIAMAREFNISKKRAWNQWFRMPKK